MMQTLCTLYGRHVFVVQRSKATLPVQDNVDTLEILSKNIQGTVSHFFIFFYFIFSSFLPQNVVHA